MLFTYVLLSQLILQKHYKLAIHNLNPSKCENIVTMTVSNIALFERLN